MIVQSYSHKMQIREHSIYLITLTNYNLITPLHVQILFMIQVDMMNGRRKQRIGMTSLFPVDFLNLMNIPSGGKGEKNSLW